MSQTESQGCVISPFTFQLGFVHPLQDVSLHQCLPLSSVCCFPVPGGSLLPFMSSCCLLHGRPLDLFPLFDCHSVQRLVHLLSFILAICPAHLHFCFSVDSIMSLIFFSFLISEHGILSCGFRFRVSVFRFYNYKSLNPS